MAIGGLVILEDSRGLTVLRGRRGLRVAIGCRVWVYRGRQFNRCAYGFTPACGSKVSVFDADDLLARLKLCPSGPTQTAGVVAVAGHTVRWGGRSAPGGVAGVLFGGRRSIFERKRGWRVSAVRW